MINKAMFRQVQAFRRQGYSKASIVKALDLDPKTVAKYFAMEEEGYRAYRQDQLYRDKVFDSYRKEILEVYEANSFRSLRSRRSVISRSKSSPKRSSKLSSLRSVIRICSSQPLAMPQSLRL